MRGRQWWPLLFLIVPVFTVACGVPISAADLALTPEATPTFEEAGIVAVSSRSVATSSDSTIRPLATTALTPQPTLSPQASSTARASATAGPSGTPTPSPAPSATPTASPFGTPPPTSTPPPASGDLVAEALAALNKYRTDSGRQPLQVDPNLAAAANAYAKTMADNNWFYCGCDFHTGPDGSQPDQRAYRAGYTGQWKGEAIAGGQGSGQQAVNTWLNSPPHAAIVLDPNSTDVGIGYYYKAGDLYAHYWVLMTGVH